MRNSDQEQPEEPAEPAEPLNRAERRARGKGRRTAAHGEGKLHGARGKPNVSPRQWANRRSG